MKHRAIGDHRSGCALAFGANGADDFAALGPEPVTCPLCLATPPGGLREAPRLIAIDDSYPWERVS